MTDAIKAPSRAARLTLKLEADHRQGLVDALHQIADAIDREEMTTGVSGGPSSGWIYEVIVDGRPTHDEYFKQVQRYLADRAAASLSQEKPHG